MLTILLFIAILSLLVLVHEAGHFFTARHFGCKVEEFGFGLPPRLFGFRRRSREAGKSEEGTIYSLNALPFGGFVKIKGEDGESQLDQDSFAHKKAWQRGVILSAGVVMNIVLAVVLLSLGYIFGVPQVIGEESKFASVKDHKIQVIEVMDESPAALAGIKMGDVISGYDNCPGCVYKMRVPDEDVLVVFQNIEEVRTYLGENVDKEVALYIQSDGEDTARFLTVQPKFLEETQRGGIGVGLIETGLVRYPFYIAPLKGLEEAASLTKQIILAFGGILKDLLTERKVGVEVTGPVGIAILTGKVAHEGILYLMYFTALLSLNLAVINFLPIPALDGGRFLFLLIEKIRGRPMDRRIEGAVHTLGFFLLITLVMVVTVKDVARFSDFWGKLFEKIGG